MTKRITLAVVLMLLVFPLVVQAQEPVDFSTVEIKLWPEYDRPDMLVIYSIQLSQDVTLPADITIRIPTSAGDPHAVAAGQPDGSLLYIPTYELVPNGDWSELSFTTTSPDIWIEYYDEALEKDASARHYEYRWPGEHTVNRMLVQVKQPLGTTNMRISPNVGKGIPGDDGLIQFNADVGSLKRGQNFIIVIDYQKETDSLSITELKVEPSDPIETTMTSDLNLKSIFFRLVGIRLSGVFLILGFLGLVLIISGGFLFWKNKQVQTKKSRSRPRHKPATERQRSPEEAGYVYCHQCGKRARAGDRFCRVCGSQLRTGS